MANDITNNRTLESKTTQKLTSMQDQIKTAGQKYSEYQSKIQSELDSVQPRATYSTSEFVEPPPEDDKKEEKKNPIIKLLDKIAEGVNKNKPKPETKPSPEKLAETEASTREEDFLETIGADTDLSIQDLIAPIDLEVDFNHLQMGQYYFRTLFVSGYPRFVGPNWLSPIINFEHSLRISTFYYPVDSKNILEKLKKKIGEMEATLYTQIEERKVVDPSLKVALSDAQQLQDSIAEGTEKFFHFTMYVTLYAKDMDSLEKISRNVISTFAAMNVTAKSATLQQESAFISTQPLGTDKLYITRNMDTTSLATTFPFVTSELTMDHGIMYGLNIHNKSLIVFDRFELPNANSVVFATSGAGKSYFIKLEALRSLMLGVEIIIIDPEREYEALAKAVNGSYISFSQDKGHKMNPFELSGVSGEDDEEDELRIKMLSLLGFFKVLFGGITNIEESILDRALNLAYREKGITLDPETQTKEPPMLEDLYKVLRGMAETEAHGLARRMEKYIIGSGAGVFNEATNFEINNPFTVFSIRDLQDELKPLAMYLMLDFIWTKIRKERKRRILIVDEAWYMMQDAESAKFMYSIAKRARKYYLGLSTITQDVADFLNNDMGRAIITNSSMQILMKQSPTAVDMLQQVFALSDGERSYLLNCDQGQGLFFAGSNHVGIQVLSSQAENEIITTNPKDLERLKEREGQTDTRTIEELAQIYDPPATQQPIHKVSGQRQDEIILGAVEKKESESKRLESERERYQRELEQRIKEQEKILNPDKYKDQAGFIDEINKRTVTGQVINSRKDIQKGRSHLTPQGVVDSYPEENKQNVPNI